MTRFMAAAFGFFLISAVADMALSQPRGGNSGPTPVQTAIATREDFTDSVEALGTTRANETVVITAKLTETVREVRFEDGQTVRRGDVLLVLDSGEETANLESAEAQAAERRSAYERAAGLEEKQIVSRASYEERRAALKQAEADVQSIRSRLGDAIIKAPFDGVLGLREVSVGTLVRPGEKITTIDDLTQMKVDFDVPSLYLQSLKPGLAVSGTVEAFGDRVFTGTVSTIDTQIDTVTRTVKVRAIVPNADFVLKPGLLMSVTLGINPRNVLVVPEGAIIQQKDKTSMFLVEGDSVKRIEVKRGQRSLGKVEILEGLEEGQEFVTVGGMNLSDGAKITKAEPR